MKLAIVDRRMPDEAKRKLTLLGCRVIEMQPDERLSEPIASHPDMLMFYHGRTIISSCEYCDRYPYIFEDISRLAPNIKLIFTDDRICRDYPHDAAYNALAAEGFIFCKADSVSKAIVKYAEECGLTLVSAKQGYPACTVLTLPKGIAISSDLGMLKALSDVGFDTYEINCGGIKLPPYEYGFIGGAAGILEDKLLFIGNPKTHPSYETIRTAARKSGLSCLSLYDGELLDLGRIIFIDSDIEYNR